MRKILVRTVWITFSLSLAGFGVAFLGLQYYIKHDPEGLFTREGVMGILSKETAVYYADGTTKVGTFFEDFHRDYQPFDSIPALLVDAVISAEDKNYYNHGGIDFKALLYALLDDIRSLSLKRGGSTITQQTAKNLFFNWQVGKWERLKAKIPEYIHALKLERKFTKQEILEFYLNQFYVSGNGKGVSIAARYFFDKDLKELDLHEIAFIAGSVKGPNQYNPFLSKTSDHRERALKRAHIRTHYVLKRMYLDRKISEDQLRKNIKRKLEFKKGDFRFRLSTNMVNIQRQMDSKAIQAKLKEYGIENYMTAGLQVYSTLDPDLQIGATYYLNKTLSDLDIVLNGYKPLNADQKVHTGGLTPGEFSVGEICSLKVKENLPVAIQVAFGIEKAWITEEALEDFLRHWNWHETGSKSTPSPIVQKEIFEKLFQIGTPLYCAVPLEYDKTKKPKVLIGQTPQIQGGARILKDGEILANAGGFNNIGYDRVQQAQRQFGSTFKPIVYAAALEMGWDPLDTLKNYRQLFKIGNLYYFPRPAHPPEDLVSILWAGRESENIASVYLLYHLFDKLKFSEFWDVCSKIGIAPTNFSSQEEFALYVRDTLGFLLYESRRMDIHYQKVRNELSHDLVFEDRVQEANFLSQLPYGDGFKDERRKYARRRNNEEALRYNILSHSFLDYYQDYREWRQRAYTTLWENTSGQVAVFKTSPPPGWRISQQNSETIDFSNILWEGKISLKTLESIREKVKPELAISGKYHPEDLYFSEEFKALAALKYIVHFSKTLGITSKIDPVLSFPLGSNVISLEEATNVYQSLQKGVLYTSKQSGQHQLLIRKITLANGKAIYEDKLKPHPVLKEHAKLKSQSILKNIIEGGTGSRVWHQLTVHTQKSQLKVPAYGKTGTTNDYRNGAFIGFISGPANESGDFSAESGYTIGVYVGFDNNKPMKRRGFIGYGGPVSLPAWIPLAQHIVKIKKYAEKVDPYDLKLQISSQIPLVDDDKAEKFAVYKHNGLVPSSGINADTNITFVTIKK